MEIQGKFMVGGIGLPRPCDGTVGHSLALELHVVCSRLLIVKPGVFVQTPIAIIKNRHTAVCYSGGC